MSMQSIRSTPNSLLSHNGGFTFKDGYVWVMGTTKKELKERGINVDACMNASYVWHYRIKQDDWDVILQKKKESGFGGV